MQEKSFPEKNTVDNAVLEKQAQQSSISLIFQLTDITSGFVDGFSSNRVPLIAKPLLDTEEAAPQIWLRFKI